MGMLRIKELRKTIITIFLVALITMPLVYAALAARTTYTIDGVKSIRLVDRCELDYFDNTVQPVRTLALACPGMDYIRLWPLPIQQLWFEDWWELVEGDVTP